MRTRPPGDCTALLGTWTLVSFRLVRHNGEEAYPFGKRAKGRLVYGGDGSFCAQLMRPHRPPSASIDPMQCTLGEMERFFKGYIAYFGTFQVYPPSSLVIHHVEGALHPNWEGQAFKRYYSLSDGLLELKTPYVAWDGTDRAVATVTWTAVSRNEAGTPPA